MDIEKLFQGIAVIFDDEVGNSGSTISKIKETIQRSNIPVATYNELPRKEIIPSLSNASFVILDWDFTHGNLVSEYHEHLPIIAEELKNEQEEKLIQFIRELLRQIFIPVFIFTSKSVDSIKLTLQDAKLWEEGKINRIFIKQKNDIISEGCLFDAIENWIKAMPSVYVLKEWEKSILKRKDTMFIKLYNYSPNWVKIIWDMMKEDAIENQMEFGDFLTRTLSNQYGVYSFDENIICAKKDEPVGKELECVLESERYLVYDNDVQPEQAYTGDLFKDGDKYFLNIRAQCDLSRKVNGEYNPELYCIKGKKINSKKVVTDDIKLTAEGFLIFGSDSRIPVGKMLEIFKDEKKIEEINTKFRNHRDGIYFRKGSFIERNDKVIIGCVAGNEILQFDLNIYIKLFNDEKSTRIGRILPPYITRIQQKCSQYMVREGNMPIPEELFVR